MSHLWAGLRPGQGVVLDTRLRRQGFNDAPDSAFVMLRISVGERIYEPPITTGFTRTRFRRLPVGEHRLEVRQYWVDVDVPGGLQELG
ncbi:hypothetical protein [Thalassiella azotivora]